MWPPGAMGVPGGGCCWRATPLPSTSSSNPDSSATSSASRTGMPSSDGAASPPSISITTVPVVDLDLDLDFDFCMATTGATVATEAAGSSRCARELVAASYEDCMPAVAEGSVCISAAATG